MDDMKPMARAKKMKRREAVPALSLRMTASLVTMALLLWTIRCGFRLAVEPWRFTDYAVRSYHIGVTTMLFGFLFLIVGLTILADLFLNISEQLQEPHGTPQVVKERRTMSKAIARASVIVITMFMLSWAIYTICRLATESKGDSKHHLLTVSMGVTTITFGFIYFIIGLAIVLELALALLSHLQMREKKNKLSPQ